MRSVESFREKIKSGGACFGCAVGFSDPLITYALADYFDFIWIEMEHCLMNQETVNGHVLAACSKNTPLFARVPGNHTHIIKPLLDSGLQGIIVPQVKSADEVEKLVEDCRYMPIGKRGFGPRIPTNFDQLDGNEYAAWSNKNIFVAVMIENTDAVEALDEILCVKALDSIIIGPSDLSYSMGFNGDTKHPEIHKAIVEIIAKSKKAGKAIGAGVSPEPEAAKFMIDLGVNWLQLGNDHHYLTRYASNLTSEIRKIIKPGRIISEEDTICFQKKF